ncbi:hypothetical protein BKI52_23370 [marine bacterium AO1-C]|nr:hypothetical protein BKI52_23370 [marine bacterium AO1-C]
MFSDGYQDQFGGLQGKKFMRKQLYEVLADNAHRPMIQQQKILEQTLVAWQQDHPQIDDILVMGIRVCPQ